MTFFEHLIRFSSFSHFPPFFCTTTTHSSTTLAQFTTEKASFPACLIVFRRKTMFRDSSENGDKSLGARKSKRGVIFRRFRVHIGKLAPQLCSWRGGSGERNGNAVLAENQYHLAPCATCCEWLASASLQCRTREKHRVPRTKAYLNQSCCGNGKVYQRVASTHHLFVTATCICWVSNRRRPILSISSAFAHEQYAEPSLSHH